MPDAALSPRRSLLAGATGLVGRALIPLMLERAGEARLTVLARNAAPAWAADPRIDWRRIDFDRLPAPFSAVDDVYLALGTTIKTAGSQNAFRHVDFDYVVAIAAAARSAGATRLAVVSALGADASSRVFYNRVKGEAEAALIALDYQSLAIAQPSLLIGDRAALGQPTRRLEVLATRLLGPVMSLVPKGMRPIAAADVAAAMVAAVRTGQPGTRRLSSAQMQGASSAHAVGGSG